MSFERGEMFIHKVLLLCSITPFLFLTVFSQYRYDCDENFCTKSVVCQKTECSGRLLKNATKCGCCHVCVEQLKEGDKCKSQELSVIPRQECGDGLICDKKEAKCVPIVSKCTEDRRNARDGDVVKCDEFGFYEPVVCNSSVLCYCVNKYGDRIFGTDVASKMDSMQCDCARDFNKFPRKIPDGNFLRCLPNGNYDPVQCSDDVCYCMGDDLHTVGTVAKTIKELLCYGERHHDDNEILRSKCWHERNYILTKIQNYTEKGVRVIGADLPQCDLDGSYAPVQCKKSECYCVKKDGNKYPKKQYIVKRNSDDARLMTCRCARDHEVLDSEKNEKVKAFLRKNLCDHKGDYRKSRVVEILS